MEARILRIGRRHFGTTESTMEAARAEAEDLDFLLVTADAQTRGRGTRGRSWQSPSGNLHLTVAVHRRHLPPERLRLFPLEAGLALWEAAAALLPPSSRPALRLKWPNDLLWEGRKAAGMLLEAAADHVFAGVGANILEAPPITDGGTPSARLAEAGAAPDSGPSLAEEFFRILQDRLRRDAGDVAGAWREKALWDRPVTLRDRPGRPEALPLDVNAEGHLRVRFPDGREEWLISDYLA